jgi:CubicO group peptidase (beta-lactamase class C family)
MQALPMDRAVESPEAYTPSETVSGARTPRTLPSTTSKRAGLRPEALQAAQKWADEHQSFALIVARNGRIVHETYAPGFNATSRYSTASMHKAVLALATGIAAAAGQISLTDRLDQRLPEFAGRPEGALTLRQLLEMAGGLNPPADAPPGPASPGAALMFGPDIRAAAGRFVQVVPPGTQFAYSNASTQLAGQMLEAALGTRYGPWLSRTLWAPLGAGDATLWLDREGGNPHYFCCLQASARDWLLVGELIRTGGKAGSRRLLPESWIETITAPSPLNPNFGMNIWRGSPHAPSRSYGLGVALKVPAKDPFAREDVLYIDGAGGQRVYVIPSEALTIIRIGKPDPQWDDSALVNLVLAGIEK